LAERLAADGMFDDTSEAPTADGTLPTATDRRGVFVVLEGREGVGKTTQ